MRTAAVSRLLCLPGCPVRLAGEIHSLVRFSKRTTRHRLRVGGTARSRVGPCPVGLVCRVVLSPAEFKLYCTVRCGVLFSVRSRYLFAIGLEEYLVFSGDARVVHRGYPTPVTRVLTRGVLAGPTGLSPCVTLRFRRLRIRVQPVMVSPDTTWPVWASVWTVSCSLAVSSDITVVFCSCRY